jgi:hypothetical protein
MKSPAVAEGTSDDPSWLCGLNHGRVHAGLDLRERVSGGQESPCSQLSRPLTRACKDDEPSKANIAVQGELLLCTGHVRLQTLKSGMGCSAGEI